MMKVFICTDFNGHYPVGTSALIIAKDIETAKSMLSKELEEIGLSQEPNFTLDEIKTRKEQVIILNDGNY